MILTAWNIKGLHKPIKQSAVQKFFKETKSDIMCLLETKFTIKALDNFMKFYLPDLQYDSNLDICSGGRIVTIWNPITVHMYRAHASKQAIHYKSRCLVSNSSFNFSAIYGFWSVHTRKPLWESFHCCSLYFTDPWLIAGDFNTTRTHEERFNRTRIRNYDLIDFNDFCVDMGFSDSTSHGVHFTWTNNQGNQRSKIDRVMVNEAWRDMEWDCHTEFLPRSIYSDHSASVSNCFKPRASKPKPFKFHNMWISHPKFVQIVEEIWNSPRSGTHQFTLTLKLQELKTALKNLNQQEFSSISERAALARKDLELAERAIEDNPADDELRSNIFHIRNRATFLTEADYQFWKQKAKIHYDIVNDRNTKFFHSSVKRRRTRNNLNILKLQDGSVTEDQETIQNEFISFYHNLFGHHEHTNHLNFDILQNGPSLEADDHLVLLQRITIEEIKMALYDIGDDKAPGPDGFTSTFFKATWDITGPHLCAAIQEFFEKKRLLKQLNHTIIALVPKTNFEPGVGDYRPIACCNVVYKIISKIITNRLVPLMPKIISNSQSAFVGDRNITDNIYLAQELVRRYNVHKNQPKCCLKIDLRKAYDTISWSFLKEVLRGLGMPWVVTEWIMQCVTTPSYSLAINGSLHGFFKGQRGIRQGDPISPFLFLMCMEYFHRLFAHYASYNDFHFHCKCKKLKITHLAFADDLMVFTRGDQTSVKITMDTLQEFSDVSGLTINKNKSVVFTTGVYGEELTNLKNLIGFTDGKWPVKYLGIPLDTKNVLINEYQALINKINEHISAWNAKTLSYAGRLQLIQSVLQGVQCYWLQIFPIPKSVLKKITSLCRKFLWGSNANPIAWDDVCLPKNESGVGLRDIVAWNKALLTKNLFKIKNNDQSLWASWFKEEILKGKNLWSWVPHHKDSKLLKTLGKIAKKILESSRDRNEANLQLDKWFAVGKGTAAAYDFFRVKGEHKVWNNTIWKPFIPPKQSFTAWMAFRGRLATRDNLRRFTTTLTCPLCNSCDESCKHLFFECRCSSQVWDHVRLWLGFEKKSTTLFSFVKWCESKRGGSSIKKKGQRIALVAAIYFIWYGRNKLIHEGKLFNPGETIHLIKTHTYKMLYTRFPPEIVMLHLPN